MTPKQPCRNHPQKWANGRVPLVQRGVVVAVDTVPSTRGGGRNTRWGLKQA